MSEDGQCAQEADPVSPSHDVDGEAHRESLSQRGKGVSEESEEGGFLQNRMTSKFHLEGAAGVVALLGTPTIQLLIKAEAAGDDALVTALYDISGRIRRAARVTTTAVMWYFGEPLVQMLRVHLNHAMPEARLAAVQALLALSDTGHPSTESLVCRRFASCLFSPDASELLAMRFEKGNWDDAIEAQELRGYVVLMGRMLTSGHWGTCLDSVCSDPVRALPPSSVCFLFKGLSSVFRRHVAMDQDELLSCASFDACLLLVNRAMQDRSLWEVGMSPADIAKVLSHVVHSSLTPPSPPNTLGESAVDPLSEAAGALNVSNQWSGGCVWQEVDEAERYGQHCPQHPRAGDVSVRVLDLLSQVIAGLSLMGGESDIQARGAMTVLVEMGLIENVTAMLVDVDTAVHARAIALCARICQVSRAAPSRFIAAGLLNVLASSLTGAAGALPGRGMRVSALARMVMESQFKGVSKATARSGARSGREPLPVQMLQHTLKRLNDAVKTSRAVPPDVGGRLVVAMKNHDPKHLKHILTSGYSMKAEIESSEGGATPVMSAAAIGAPASMQALIEADADINQNCVATALHFAVAFGRVDQIAFLLRNGADVNRQDCNGFTPLALARECGNRTGEWQLPVSDGEADTNQAMASSTTGVGLFGSRGTSITKPSISTKDRTGKATKPSILLTSDTFDYFNIVKVVEAYAQRLGAEASTNGPKVMVLGTGKRDGSKKSMSVLASESEDDNDTDTDAKSNHSSDAEDDEATLLGENSMQSIQNVLQKPPQMRVDKELRELLRLVRGIRQLRKLPDAVRLSVVRHFEFRVVPPNQTLTQLGETIQTMWFLLNGNAAVVSGIGTLERVDVMEPLAFDAIRAKEGAPPPKAGYTSKTISTCEFLCLDRVTARTAIKKANEVERERKVHFIASLLPIPHLETPMDEKAYGSWQQGTFLPQVNGLATALQPEMFTGGTVLIHRGDVVDYVYFITAGECDAVIDVEFMKPQKRASGKGSTRGDQETVLPSVALEIGIGRRQNRFDGAQADARYADTHGAKKRIPQTALFSPHLLRQNRTDKKVIAGGGRKWKKLRLTTMTVGDCFGDVEAWSGAREWPLRIVAATRVDVLKVKLSVFKSKFPKILQGVLRQHAAIKAERRQAQAQTLVNVMQCDGWSPVQNVPLLQPIHIPVPNDHSATEAWRSHLLAKSGRGFLNGTTSDNAADDDGGGGGGGGAGGEGDEDGSLAVMSPASP